MHEVDGGKVVWEYFEAQLDSDDSWTDLSQEGLNSDPVAMDVSIEAKNQNFTAKPTNNRLPPAQQCGKTRNIVGSKSILLVFTPRRKVVT